MSELILCENSINVFSLYFMQHPMNPFFCFTTHRARALHKLRQPYRNHTVKCYASEL